MMYDTGQGVPQDYAQAAVWYRKSADQGDDAAQFALGGMYEGGRGVPQNYVSAHMWFNLAASRANNATRSLAVEERDTVAAKMTLDQIAEAQRMAREWTPK
jgi:hypothetical protein